jgi:hypothetical protein
MGPRRAMTAALLPYKGAGILPIAGRPRCLGHEAGRMMDMLVMHRTLTEAGIPGNQADAILKVIQGGVANKQDLDLAVMKLERRMDTIEGRIERLDGKVNPLFGVGLIAVLAPAITRLIGG